jgi:hypothetical protein
MSYLIFQNEKKNNPQSKQAVRKKYILFKLAKNLC